VALPREYKMKASIRQKQAEAFLYTNNEKTEKKTYEHNSIYNSLKRKSNT
jgi:hypothetical protein